MNAVAANGTDRSNAGTRRPVQAAMSLLLGLAASGALALDDMAPPATLAASATAVPVDRMPLLQLEVSGSSLPRFDNTDGSTRASRIDMTWLPPRRSALGLSLGMTSIEGPAFSAAGPYAGAAPSVDLGLQWRDTLDSNYRLDVRAWRRVVPADALTLVEMRQPSYGARVEMQIGSTRKSSFVADRGFLGLQLESGARVTLRRSGGKPMVYYRTGF
jgi:hypothetical protein